MKHRFQHVGLARLCAWFGISRQAYYQNIWRCIDTSIEEELIIKQIKQIRKYHRRMGTRKLYEKLGPFMQEHGIKMGRDALFDLVCRNHLQVRKRKRSVVRTTQSCHWLRKYPNLIRDFIATKPNELWVSDITYWKMNENKVAYISLITDAYSHKIVGYHIAETLETIETIKALEMALSTLDENSDYTLIHHSDRGIQYCSKDYVKLLRHYNIEISMTENGDPLENAIAERVNGILKEEYLFDYKIETINKAKTLLKKVVNLYNSERPHMSIGNLTPNQLHEKPIKTEKLWKNYYRK